MGGVESWFTNFIKRKLLCALVFSTLQPVIFRAALLYTCFYSNHWSFIAIVCSYSLVESRAPPFIDEGSNTPTASTRPLCPLIRNTVLAPSTRFKADKRGTTFLHRSGGSHKEQDRQDKDKGGPENEQVALMANAIAADTNTTSTATVTKRKSNVSILIYHPPFLVHHLRISMTTRLHKIVLPLNGIRRRASPSITQCLLVP